MPVRGFFAYPQDPAILAETIRIATSRINSSLPQVEIVTWEDNRVVGKVVIDEICNTIESRNLFLADLTGMNPNVMFELGYAVARKKRIWIILDTTSPESKRDYQQLQILTGVGYASYRNSQDILSAFTREEPYNDLEASIFSRSIEPTLTPGDPQTLFYLRSLHETEADRHLTELVSKFQSRGLPATFDDPREARVNPLTWYGQKVYSAISVLAHLSSERREGWQIHNARYAFVCGLAHGLEKPLLMLAEEDYSVPFDYRGLLVRYPTTRECIEHASLFLEQARSRYTETRTPRELFLTVQLATELKGLRLGEYVAENEADQLEKYFVETAAYREALLGRHMVFVGRRGAGKTANLLQASKELGNDRRNLVIAVRPAGYDLEAVVRLLRKYRQKDTKGYLVESLWKFLIYTEIATATTETLEAKLSAGLSKPEEEFLNFVRGEGSALTEDFAVRLERAIDALLKLEEVESVEANRLAISEALHGTLLPRLRDLLSRVLHGRERVVILVDNLDKTWKKNGELEQLSEFLLGLLSAGTRIPLEFKKADFRRSPVNLSLTVFLRSDIYYNITQAAREPDKIPCEKIAWDDPELLVRVIEQRFLASQSRPPDNPRELWQRYFSPTVRGIPTRTYVATIVLPRPRDIVYLVRAAISSAVNRGHSRVEEEDLLDAEKQYSHYALETIEVEGGVTLPKIRDILYEFLGAREILGTEEIEGFLARAGVEEAARQSVIDQLAALSLLGIETRPDQFAFAGDEEERTKMAILARKLSEAKMMPPRFKVHQAFHRFLEINPADS